jgi:hypothetical protein
MNKYELPGDRSSYFAAEEKSGIWRIVSIRALRVSALNAHYRGSLFSLQLIHQANTFFLELLNALRGLRELLASKAGLCHLLLQRVALQL